MDNGRPPRPRSTLPSASRAGETPARREIDLPTGPAQPVVRRARGEERAYVVVTDGPHAGQLASLPPGGGLLIGRGETADLQISDEGVSRAHARITLVGPKVAWVEDLGSRNGTYLNGERLIEGGEGRVALASGDCIQMGEQTTLRFDHGDLIEESYHRRLVEAAVRDPVTQVYNRRHLDERLVAEASAARRHARPLALLLIDIDHFKRINDTHGHTTGDEALAKVAALLAKTVRREDVVARYGGDEFVVLSRETLLDGARLLAERIRHGIEKITLDTDGKPEHLTASLGIAVYTASAEANAEAGPDLAKLLLDQADDALYQAKAQGRNHVASWPQLKSVPK